MKKYEGMFIVKPDMEKEVLEKTLGSIEETITKNGGRAENCQHWARRRLAYPIKKFMEGEYYICNFESEPRSISTLEASCKLNDNILRILITAKEK